MTDRTDRRNRTDALDGGDERDERDGRDGRDRRDRRDDGDERSGSDADGAPFADRLDPGPSDGIGADDPADGSATAPSDRTGRDGPLSDLASAVDERTDRSGGDDAFDDLFEREDITEIDSDQLWERLENDRSPRAVLEEEREIREIEKHSYCHRCEHFSEPPSVECTREGTEILELSSLETFRVADCPVVLEDEELERQY